jgi:hypothetical protein
MKLAFSNPQMKIKDYFLLGKEAACLLQENEDYCDCKKFSSLSPQSKCQQCSSLPSSD